MTWSQTDGHPTLQRWMASPNPPNSYLCAVGTVHTIHRPQVAYNRRRRGGSSDQKGRGKVRITKEDYKEGKTLSHSSLKKSSKRFQTTSIPFLILQENRGSNNVKPQKVLNTSLPHSSLLPWYLNLHSHSPSVCLQPSTSVLTGYGMCPATVGRLRSSLFVQSTQDTCGLVP